MKRSKRNCLWVVLVLAGIVCGMPRYLQADQRVVDYTDGFVVFRNLETGNIEKIKLDRKPSTIVRSPSGTRCLLQYQGVGRPALIYEVGRDKPTEVLLDGECIAVSDRDKLILRRMDENNQVLWQVFDDNGAILSDISGNIELTTAEFTSDGTIITCGRSADLKKVLTIYNQHHKVLYQNTFGDKFTRIVKLLACAESKVVVFTFRKVHWYDIGEDRGFGPVQDTSFSIFDYAGSSNVLQKQLSTQEPFAIDVTSSQDGRFLAGLINSSEVFVINVESGEILFTKPFAKVVNGDQDSEIIQIEVSNDAAVHILQQTADGHFAVYENYDSNGNITQMQPLGDMGHQVRMQLGKREVTIINQGQTKTFQTVK